MIVIERKKTNEEKMVELNANTIKLKDEINDLLEQEHLNTEQLEQDPLYYEVPTKADLYDTEPKHYDAATHVCVAFRRKDDLWKDLPMPFGNMIGGFPFEMNGVLFPSSEQAYIAGLFSNNTPEHIQLQKELLNEASGYMAKRNTRAKHADQWRTDWTSFNIDWMLYCVWNKVQKNEAFRKSLMAVPRNAMLIEDVSFQLKPKGKKDTTIVWGCRNEMKKEFGRLVKKYVSSLDFPTKKAANDAENELLWDYCNVGEYVGQNIMGEILTIVKNCLHEGTEPDIDYDLLNSKEIHLFGEKLVFPSK